MTKKKIATSPDRNTFLKERYLDRCKEEGKEPNESYLTLFDNIETGRQNWESQEHIDNLEYDLRTTEWIVEKVRSSESYAQNIYAALCNNDFQKLEAWPILKDEQWGCSWRYAGGIVADLRGHGDYIDWYCSGSRSKAHTEDNESFEKGFVSEGTVTNEVYEDLLKLGWKVLDNTND
jgi:hypothetical protein